MHAHDGLNLNINIPLAVLVGATAMSPTLSLSLSATFFRAALIVRMSTCIAIIATCILLLASYVAFILFACVRTAAAAAAPLLPFLSDSHRGGSGGEIATGHLLLLLLLA